MIAVDANAEWKLSKQIGDALFTPMAHFLNEWKFWISLVIGGMCILYGKGDFKKKSIVVAMGFGGCYTFLTFITYLISIV